MNIIFHMGFHKTGTTTIQNCLTQAHEELLRQEIFYPLELGTYEIQHGIIPDLLKLNSVEQAVSLIEEVKDQALLKKCSTIIISAEEFENLAINQNLEIFFLKISALFKKIDICCASRNIFDLIKSKIRQRLIHFGFDLHNSHISMIKLIIDTIEKQSYITNRFKDCLHIVNFDAFKIGHSKKNIVHFVFEDLLPQISTINFSEHILNQSRALNSEELLTPLVRCIYGKNIKKNPYSIEVNNLVKKFFSEISGPNPVLINDINQKLIRVIDDILIETDIDFDKYFFQFNTPDYLQNILVPKSNLK